MEPITKTATPLADTDLAELRRLEAARTSKKLWHWDIRPQGKSISLCSGWDTVLDATRWGMGGATIRMEDPENPGCLSGLHTDAVAHAGRQHHFDWAQGVNPARTDAHYLTAACNAVPGLLARLDAAEAAAAELPKVQEYVRALLNDLLNHPELPASIHAKLWAHRQQITVKP